MELFSTPPVLLFFLGFQYFIKGRGLSQFLFAFGGEMFCVVVVGRSTRRPRVGILGLTRKKIDSIQGLWLALKYFELLDISIMRII